MDRCAVFVDAGYVFAEAGNLCLGTKSRAKIECAFGELLASLARAVRVHSDIEVLRTYWYDAAPNGVPTEDQRRVAALPKVKLRLGRLSGRHQKGVDALIYRDLMTLARERAMVKAYLVSGDEDLREGVVAAQDMGVQVVLVGVPAASGSNQAESLIHEADEHWVLTPGFWKEHFTPREPSTQSGTLAGPASATVVGANFASQWATRANLEGLHDMLDARPRIPPNVDVELLLFGESQLGSLRGDDERRKQLRAGFWEQLAALGAERG